MHLQNVPHMSGTLSLVFVTQTTVTRLIISYSWSFISNLLWATDSTSCTQTVKPPSTVTIPKTKEICFRRTLHEEEFFAVQCSGCNTFPRPQLRGDMQTRNRQQNIQGNFWHPTLRERDKLIPLWWRERWGQGPGRPALMGDYS